MQSSSLTYLVGFCLFFGFFCTYTKIVCRIDRVLYLYYTVVVRPTSRKQFRYLTVDAENTVVYIIMCIYIIVVVVLCNHPTNPFVLTCFATTPISSNQSEKVSLTINNFPTRITEYKAFSPEEYQIFDFSNLIHVWSIVLFKYRVFTLR